MQTDPIGYKDGLNWYEYVDNDPVNNVDPTGNTCKNSGDKLTCIVDDKKNDDGRPLTDKEKKEIAKFELAYTKAVKYLLAHSGKTVSITVGGKTFSVNAGEEAKSLEGRWVTAIPDRAGNAGTDSQGRMEIYSVGLAGKVDPYRDKTAMIDREVTVVHEGTHRSRGEIQAFPNPYDPATNNREHGLPYDNAARQLLDIGP